MTKAERRKRARQRAKERVEGGATPPPSVREPETAPVAALSPSVPVPPSPASEFITGPITVSAPHPVRLARIELPADAPVRVPSAGDEEELEAEDEDEEEATEDDDGEDTEDGDEGEDGDDEDDGDDDEELEALEDAIFNVACGAVEQGEKFTWNELIQGLCEVEVTDPRLGLVVALLVDQDDAGKPLPLTGDRVLTVLNDLGLAELVAEAREVATLAPGEDGETPEERAVVRTNTRDLKAQAEAELPDRKKPNTGGARPLKASQLRAPQTALGRGAPVPSTVPTTVAPRRAGR